MWIWNFDEYLVNLLRVRTTIQSRSVGKTLDVHSLSRMYDRRYRTKVRIARTDLVNFMIDDLVESSLGFLKRKEKKNKKRRNAWSCDIAFILLKSILCIINIVDCIVREYIIYIWYARGNYTGNKTAGNNSCTIILERKKRKRWRRKKN